MSFFLVMTSGHQSEIKIIFRTIWPSMPMEVKRDCFTFILGWDALSMGLPAASCTSSVCFSLPCFSHLPPAELHAPFYISAALPMSFGGGERSSTVRACLHMLF